VVLLYTLDIMTVRVGQDQPNFLLCGKDVADQVLLQIRGEVFKFYPTEHCLHINDISLKSLLKFGTNTR